MKRFFITLFCLLSITVLAEKKLDGCFGQTFGKIKVPTNNSRNEQHFDKSIKYFYVPPKKFMGFQKFFYLLTPKSKKVYCIIAEWDVEEDDNVREKYNNIVAVLENHFKMRGKKESSFDHGWTTFTFDNAKIIVRYIDGFDYGLIVFEATSTEYEKLNEKEKRQRAILETDTSGLL